MVTQGIKDLYQKSDTALAGVVSKVVEMNSTIEAYRLFVERSFDGAEEGNRQHEKEHFVKAAAIHDPHQGHDAGYVEQG